MSNKYIPENSIIFREVCGEWRRVDSPSQKPQTLADWLTENKITMDDDTQFLRIIRMNKTIEIRHYGGQYRCNISEK